MPPSQAPKPIPAGFRRATPQPAGEPLSASSELSPAHANSPAGDLTLVLVVPDETTAKYLNHRAFVFIPRDTDRTIHLRILVDTAPMPSPDTVHRLVAMADLGLDLEDLKAIRPTLQLGDR